MKVLKSNFNFAKPAKLNVHLYTKEPQLRVRGKTPTAELPEENRHVLGERILPSFEEKCPQK